MIRKGFFLVVCLFFSLFCTSQEVKYQSVQDAFLASSELQNAAVGLYAKNLKTGEILLEYNPAVSLTPASILKLFTTALAIERFGQNKRFKTSLAYNGQIENGVLHGDIIIIGGGDPCFGSQRYKSVYGEDLLKNWAAEIQKLGINSVEGNIISDISYFGENPIPDKWVWEDLAAYYGSQGGSLNYLDNIYELHFTTKVHKDTAELTGIVPADLQLNVINKVISSSQVGSDNTMIYKGIGENDIVIKGSLPCNKSDFVVKGSIPNPALFIAQRLGYQLDSLSIRVEGKAVVRAEKADSTEVRTSITSVSSPTLLTIANYTNLQSFNLYAEVLRLHLQRSTGQDFSDYATSFMKRNSLSHLGFYSIDGSGVSHFNAITARQTVDLLEHINKSKYGEAFKKGMAEAGKTGTLRSYKCCSGGKIKFIGKTGSMTRVRSLAGYVTNVRGEEIAFCVILNNYKGKSKEMRTLLDEFVKKIGNQ